MRRLRNDLAALERLKSESSVFRFTTHGDPPNHYRIVFQGRGLWRDHGKVKTIEKHHVEIKLGSSYPRTMPELRWLTPIYHPNISEIGMVCLGGYGTHWVPSVQLDELCVMLWDMLRYHNYDIRSPYNRDSALWVASQTAILFPTDPRPLRDLRAALGRVETTTEGGPVPSSRDAANGSARSSRDGAASVGPSPVARVQKFVERYGRVFGTASTPKPGHQRPNEGAKAVPSNPELQALVAAEASADPVRNDPDDGVLILDHHHASPSEHRPQPGRPASDDIVFIE
ncbi:MAG: ubiquitin-conjugating enzyme E2 [Isosphaeraceae bacterium]